MQKFSQSGSIQNAIQELYQGALQGLEEKHSPVRYAVCANQSVDGAAQTDDATGMNAPGDRANGTSPWNAVLKDKLENRLNREMCAGHITLQQAREMFVNDWREAYKKYYGEP